MSKTGVFEAEIDVVGESAVEVGGDVGRVVEAVCAVAACAGGEDHAVAFFEGAADVVFGSASADSLDYSDVFVAEDDFALEAVLPHVQVGAADPGQLLAEQHFAGFRARVRGIRGFRSPVLGR